MKFYEVIFLMCFLHSKVKCDHPFLIGSALMSSDSIYEVFLAGNKLDDNSIIDIALRAQGYEANVNKTSSYSYLEPIRFMLPEDHHSSYELEMKFMDGNGCKKQTIKLINMSRRPIILIQLDKPVYKIGDNIKFRVFVLTHQLVPHRQFNKMSVVIYDNNGIIQGEFNKVTTSDFGVYNNSTQILENVNLGRWKIEVEVDGKKSSKTFIVNKMRENFIQIDLIGDDEVALNYKTVNLAINVKHPVDQAFFGKGRVLFSKGRENKGNAWEVKVFNLTQQYTKLKFDISDDLLIQSINDDLDLNFRVEIQDRNNNLVAREKKTVVLKRKDLHFVASKKEYFVPGEVFPVKVEVRRLNGQLDNSFGSLKVSIEYSYGDEVETDQFLTDLEGGKKLLILDPPINATEMKLCLKFGNEEFKQIIKGSNQIEKTHYLYATLVYEKTSYSTGDEIEVSVKSDEKIDTLYVLVLGPTGMVQNRIITNEHPIQNLSFKLNITDLMIPKSTMIMYFVKENGTIIHDYLTVNSRLSSENELKINIPTTSNANQLINIKVKTAENSKVFLTATDSIRELDNEILFNSLAKSFITLGSHEKNSLNEFGVFSLDLSKGSVCGSRKVDTTFADKLEKISTNIEVAASNFFPNIWFDDEIIVNQKDTTIQQTTPDMPGTWKIQGIAIHPTKGFSIAQSQPIIKISKNTSITIKGPKTVNASDILSVIYAVENIYEQRRSLKLKILVENGELLDKNGVLVKNKYEISEEYHFTNTHLVTSVLKILAKDGEKLIIKFKVERENYESSIEIDVKQNDKTYCNKEFSKSLMYKVQSFNLSVLQNDENKKPEILQLINTNHLENKILERTYENLLEPIIGSGLESIFKPQYEYDEFTVDKIALSLIAYEYYKFIGDSKNLMKMEKVFPKKYEDLEKILKEADNLTPRFLAYALETIIEGQAVLNVSDENIMKYLYVIRNHQLGGGSFAYNNDLNLKRGMGYAKNQKIINTAKITPAFSKNKILSSVFPTIIEDSLKYLHEESSRQTIFDYEKIMNAYNYALNGTLDKAKTYVNQMSCNFLKIVVIEKFKSLFIEIASYTILTKILLDEDPQNEVKWLLRQRSPDGRFYSPHDTVLAHRALLEFIKYAKNTGLIIKNESTDELRCRMQNNNNVTSSSKQKYTFSYRIGYEESNLISDKLQFFNVSTRKININETFIAISLDFTLNPTLQIQETNLVIIEVRLPTTFRFFQLSDSEGNAYKTHLQDDGNLVILYIKKISVKKMYSYFLAAEKYCDVKNKRDAITSYAKVYDFYQPNLSGLSYINSS